MINAIILAAGKGSRLGNLTQDKPKCLVEILPGKTILDIQLEQLLATDQISLITIMVGYKSEVIASYIENKYPDAPIVLQYNSNYQNTNTALSLLTGLQTLANKDLPVLQLNGDVVFSSPVLSGFISQCAADKSYTAIRSGQLGAEEMKVVFDSTKHRVRLISKQVLPELAIGEAFGLNYFSPAFSSNLEVALEHVQYVDHMAYFEAAINQLLHDHELLVHDIGDNFAMEIDDVNDLSRCKMYLPSKDL